MKVEAGFVKEHAVGIGLAIRLEGTGLLLTLVDGISALLLRL